MVEDKYLAIAILVGGKSTRFGTDKAVIELVGKPLIVHQIDILSCFDKDVYLVAHSEEQIFRYKKQIQFPEVVKFLTDDKEILENTNIFRPMLGVYSALKELSKLGFHKVFLLSCDMPLIKPKVIELIIDEGENYDAAIPRWKSGYLEPFFAMYTIEKALAQAKKIVESQNWGIYNLINKSWNINYVSVEGKIRPMDKNLVSLMNINGPIDLVKFAKFYAKSKEEDFSC